MDGIRLEKTKVKLGIFGVTGRMGRAIASLALAEEMEVAPLARSCVGEDLGLLLGKPPNKIFVSTTLEKPLPHVLIDCSLAEGLKQHIEIALQFRLPLVVGSTGLKEDDFEAMRVAAKEIPVFYSANFSIGMALFKRLARQAAEVFAEEAHIDLIETHHAEKKDAPSGSALSIKKAMGCELNIHSIRSGHIVGEHVLQFNTAAERMIISHQVHTRDTFARGALQAARFIQNRSPGWYEMDDLLAEKRDAHPS